MDQKNILRDEVEEIYRYMLAILHVLTILFVERQYS